MPTIPLSQPEFDYNLEPPDWVALSLLVRKIDEELARKQRHLLMKVSHWFLALDLLREFEDGHLIVDTPNVRDREYHRMVIASLMGHGESLLMEVTKQHEIQPESIGLKLADIEANVRYLRDLYSRWFTDMTDRQKDAVLDQLFSVQTPDPQKAS